MFSHKELGDGGINSFAEIAYLNKILSTIGNMGYAPRLRNIRTEVSVGELLER